MSRYIVRALLRAACAVGFVACPGETPGQSAVEEYVFVPDTEREVMILREDFILFGKLDAAGNFLETFRRDLRLPGSGAAGDAIRINAPDYTSSGPKPRPVYEYRSGRLIKGVIDAKGNFVPDLGSTVIPFKDYRYTP